MERFWVLAVGAILGTALGGCADQGPPSLEPRDMAATTEATMEATQEATQEEAPPEGSEDGHIVDHAFSASDDTDLVDISDNVFVGRVEERVGVTGVGSDRPWGSTRFSVRVLENVKGRLGDGQPERGVRHRARVPDAGGGRPAAEARAGE